MVKKKNLTLATSAVSSGAATKTPPNPSRRSASDAPPPAPAPPALASSMARPSPGDWPVSTTTKRDEKRARSLGIISSDEGNVILPAAEKAKALPSKRPSDGFADEDDLYDFGLRGFDSCCGPHGSNFDSFFPFQREGDFFDCRSYSFSSRETSVISSLEAFASQYTSLEVDKARLQKEVESSSSKLEGAIKIAAEARQEVDSLKDELEGLKRSLKDEETSRLAAEARMIENDDLLRQSTLALLILDKIPNNSPANALSLTLESHKLVQDLLQKGKGSMARMHSMIFPKIDQNKTLGQLIDAFAINTKEVIEVFLMILRVLVLRMIDSNA
ncbi:hypothetical protein QYE76_069617 [Lolium multiflorum]|uniref:Uncharacterized protein n=1 Tax=Lolium multiflorum TaxID=4521 RepID=A0AAD8WF35_LOLMU|nr:hypothetical protein QYE76_069617 [Lolium multiflorum]